MGGRAAHPATRCMRRAEGAPPPAKAGGAGLVLRLQDLRLQAMAPTTHATGPAVGHHGAACGHHGGAARSGALDLPGHPEPDGPELRSVLFG